MPPAGAPEGAPGGIDDFSRASVLIVDDQVQNVELLQGYLEDVGCDLRTAHDGPEALTQIEERQPDLVLLDVMMPRMSGFQVCKQIKSAPATRDIQVIMVTALNEIADIEKARECGTDDFVTKPVNRIELVLRVTSLLKMRLLKQELERTISELKRMRGDSASSHPPPPL
jgi:CheY-like chemotaxis protein